MTTRTRPAPATADDATWTQPRRPATRLTAARPAPAALSPRIRALAQPLRRGQRREPAAPAPSPTPIPTRSRLAPSRSFCPANRSPSTARAAKSRPRPSPQNRASGTLAPPANLYTVAAGWDGGDNPARRDALAAQPGRLAPRLAPRLAFRLARGRNRSSRDFERGRDAIPAPSRNRPCATAAPTSATTLPCRRSCRCRRLATRLNLPSPAAETVQEFDRHASQKPHRGIATSSRSRSAGVQSRQPLPRRRRCACRAGAGPAG